MVKMSGTLKKSTDIMKAVHRLTRLPEIAKQMQEMAMEMQKVGRHCCGRRSDKDTSAQCVTIGRDNGGNDAGYNGHD